MKAELSTYWREVASGRRHDILASFFVITLMPMSLLYSMIQYLRCLLYKSGIWEVKMLPRPVISVGNISVGGTGKTPVTIYLAELLMQMGLRVAVLSRGYGGSMEGETATVTDGKTVLLKAEQCGDEPFLMANKLPGLIVVIGPDRHSAGILAMTSFAPDVFILDDGFQHIRLHRDLDILLLDYNNPFGNGWSLPAGLMRESKSAIARADLIIKTRSPLRGVEPSDNVGTPISYASHKISDIVSLTNNELFPVDVLKNKKVTAFAGIADPDSFFTGLEIFGLKLASTLRLADHTDYNDGCVKQIEDVISAADADFAITTEKDGVKLENLPKELREKVLLARLEITIDDQTPIKVLLSNLLQK